MKIIVLAVVFVCVAALKRDADIDGLHPRSPQQSLPARSEEQENEYWVKKAQATLLQQTMKKPNTNIAKNLIMFLGDGMSVATLTSARIYQAQIAGERAGEGEFLSFEEFPYTGLSRTYCVDKQVADSACSATAYLGGVKGNEATIGVNAHVLRGDCQASLNQSTHVDSIAKWAQEAGKATGIVTTTRITHASPAGAYAHVADRNWESDGETDPGCDDIAKQLILNQPGNNFNVIMGGGRSFFIPENENDPENGKGSREDGLNLIEAWKSDKEQRAVPYTFVWNRTDLLSVDNTSYLLGLFAKDHLNYHLENVTSQPTLEEMTVQAIKTLQQSGKSYFLFVEGGKIDLAHHDNKAHISLDETVEFSKAIAAAVKITDESDTLIVVTADHAHTMTINGYASRSESVFGFGGEGDDQKPYTVLSYANGPGYRTPTPDGRPDPSEDDTERYDYKFPATVPLDSETHGGDDVAVFARGPWAHLFVGSFEQNFIPHAMAFASCIGSGLTACEN